MSEKNGSYQESDILRYAEGLAVPPAFREALAEDPALMKKVVRLKEELFLMNELPNSPLFTKYEEPAKVRVHLLSHAFSLVESFGFTTLLPQGARGGDDAQVTELLANTLEVVHESEETFAIKVPVIERALHIERDGKEIHRHTGRGRDVFVSQLAKGAYRITVDGECVEIDAS